MSTKTGNSSLPDLPEELSFGSSVSTAYEKEYEDILKHAIVAPVLQLGEDVYKKDFIEEINVEADSEFSESNESIAVAKKYNGIRQDYRMEKKITEAKEAVGSKKSVETKHTRFNVTSNALDSLLGYADTPKNTHKKSYQSDDSTSDSTPDVCPHRSPTSSSDPDLLRMDALMDDWTTQLKRNVLAELADMKASQLQHEENVLNELNLRHNAEILRLSHEVENLKELLYSFEQSVRQKDEVIQNLTEALSKQKGKCDKIRLFGMWKLKHNDEQRNDFSTKMAEKFYKRTLTMKVWAGWRSVVESKWRQRVEKACQIKSQEICLKLTQDYEERLQALQKELASARSEVAKMHTERDCYEENMKKAFMRGVCALNMEAMSMFHEGRPEENVPGTSYDHHPCTGPAPFSPTNAQTNGNGVLDSVETNLTSHHHSNEQSRKHVTFAEISSSQPSAPNRKGSNNNTRTSFNNRKNLNVKLTSKKDYVSKRNTLTGPIHQSSVSSVKVERHVPLDQPSTPSINNNNNNSSSIPLQYARGTSCEKYRKQLSSVPTVKVVD